MIDLYYSPGPNGRKISIFCEEAGLAYRLIPVDAAKGEQFSAEFLRINPNNRVPAIVDPDGPDGQPISVFESGAILLYLGNKIGRFVGDTPREKVAVMEWLFWQMGGLGPIGGQLSHFVNFADHAGNDYARDRYYREYDRLLGVMDRGLADHAFLAGEGYTVADIAAFPWLLPKKAFGVDIDRFPNTRRWFDAIKVRPAVQRAVALGHDWGMERGNIRNMTEAERKIAFGQTHEMVVEAAKKG
jgi:GST-like protein